MEHICHRVPEEVSARIQKGIGIGNLSQVGRFSEAQLGEYIKKPEEKLLSQLPFDVIIFISKHLDLFDCLRLRSVCKSFQSAIPPVQWRASPVVLFRKDFTDGYCKVWHPFSNDSPSSVMEIPLLNLPQLDAVDIRFSKNGWLILEYGQNCFTFFNPFTRVRKDLPPCPGSQGRISQIAFSTCPTSSDCLTVGISMHGEDVYIRFFLSIDNKWCSNKLSCYSEGEKFRCSSNPVYYKGEFYFLGSEGILGAFRILEGEETNWQYYNRPIEFFKTFELMSCHLVVCNGELLAVFIIGRLRRYIQMFSFNHLTKHWVEITSLGNHVLFLGHSSSYSIVATESWMYNRIYLPSFNGRSILFYSLDSGKYHISGKELIDYYFVARNMFYGTCCWI